MHGRRERVYKVDSSEAESSPLAGSRIGDCGGACGDWGNLMSENRDAGERLETTDSEFKPGRRKALQIGALVVPTIVTLHATPAWAATDYTVVAYRYGDNAGLCRNPKFNPMASPTSPNGQEFIACPDGSPGGGGGPRASNTSGDATGQSGLGPTDIRVW